mgnify:CR=1 FL=1
MKIEDKRTDKGAFFGELSIGDCFIFEDECYIKIDELCASPNTFNLVRNEIDTIRNNTLPITKVNAKVVIE